VSLSEASITTQRHAGRPDAAAEALLERFEQAWQQGESPALDAYLGSAAAGRESLLLAELVKIDLECRWRRAGPGGSGMDTPATGPEDSLPQRPRLEDYLRRYPGLGPGGELPLDLIGEEYRVRHWWGDRPGQAEYRQRFPNRGAPLDELLARIDAEMAAEGRPAVAGLEDFEVLEELGRGGAGVVYKARQKSLQRLVALKVLSAPGPAGGPEMERFRAEARLAAGLIHPSIVQIYEVGESNGQPYLCLEHVAGGTLSQRLAGAPLPAAQAATLGETLARAVHYAHERGVIHRDLKPANVLLSVSGRSQSGVGSAPLSERPLNEWVPKITDFGLAKKLDEQGLTQTGAILGTPSYMAPEQAAGGGKTVGPAADVYALGAVLYECLTGRPPFRGATILQTLEQVRTQEPAPPRSLQPGVPRELETICLKCLEKDPKRRYATALALAEDLRRFGAGEPIVARPVGAVGRAVKWARRRPALAALVAVSAAAVLALALGGWWSSVRLRAALGRAERNRDRAEANLDKAFAAVDRLLGSVAEERLKDVPEMDEVRQQLLKDALALCQDLAGQEEANEDKGRHQVALAHWRLGRIRSLLGQTDQAEEDLRVARAMQEELVARFPEDPTYLDEFADICESQYGLYAKLGRREEAHAAASRAATLWDALAPHGPRYRARLAGVCIPLAGLAGEVGQAREAEDLLRRSVELRTQLVRENPGLDYYAYELALSHYWLGRYLQPRGDRKAAEQAYRAAQALCEPLCRAHPERRDYQDVLIGTYGNLALVVGEDRSRRAEAEALQRQRLEKAEAQAQDYPRRVDVQNGLATALYNYGLVLEGLDRRKEARDLYARAAQIRERLVRENPGQPDLRAELAQTFDVLGLACAHLGQLGPSQDYFRRARDLLDPLVRQHPENVEYGVSLGSVCNNAALVLRDTGRPAEAMKWHDRAVRTLEDALTRSPQNSGLRTFAVNAYGARAGTREQLGRYAEAAADWGRAIDLAEGDSRRDSFRTSRAICRLKQGAHAAALPEVEAMASDSNPAGDTLYNLACVASLASAAVECDPLLSAPGRAALAEHCCRRALELLRRAQAAGAFATPEMRDTLRKDDDLAPLRHRDDFRRFLDGVINPVPSKSTR
jgi:tetratricopeptide (TPR) repeat protein